MGSFITLSWLRNKVNPENICFDLTKVERPVNREAEDGVRSTEKKKDATRRKREGLISEKNVKYPSVLIQKVSAILCRYGP